MFNLRYIDREFELKAEVMILFFYLFIFSVSGYIPGGQKVGLWMVAGGFALGVALNETGLAANLINSIPFNTWPVLAVLIGSGIICYTLSNFISNTATAALLVPILAVVGKSMTAELAPIGGVACLLIGIAVAASVAMILPISTPPNALAHGTGMIEQKYMAKSGLIMGIIGLVLGYGMLILLGSIGFFG